MHSLWKNWVNNDSYFDDLAVFGLGTLHPGGIEATKELLGYLDWNEKKVLDVGCGNGTTMRLLQGLGACPIGIESSLIMRNAALQNGIDKDRLIAGKIEAVNLNHEEFDVLVIEGVLGFLSDPISIIQKLSQALKPEGHFLIFDWIPHQRIDQSNAQYGFTVFGKTDPHSFIGMLNSLGYTCDLRIQPAMAHRFSLQTSEATRRAQLFFPDADKKRLEIAVARKVNLMSMVLSQKIPCERFFLAGYKKGSN